MSPVEKLCLLILCLCCGIFYVGQSACNVARLREYQTRVRKDEINLFPNQFGFIQISLPQMHKKTVVMWEDMVLNLLEPFGNLLNKNKLLKYKNDECSIYILCQILIHGLSEGSIFHTISRNDINTTM